MGIQARSDTYVIRMTILVVFHAAAFIGTGLVRQWIDMFPIVTFLYPHLILLAAVSLLGVLLVWLKQYRYGIITLLFITVFTLLYNISTRFFILPPIIPRTLDIFPKLLYEFVYWISILMEVGVIWISIQMYRKILFIHPDEKEESETPSNKKS
ncbi:MAG: hypothetical protein KBG83_05135 [Bacteroidetes bacterium]|nr:hypothetical protein [Bacteroidota bacterium]